MKFSSLSRRFYFNIYIYLFITFIVSSCAIWVDHKQTTLLIESKPINRTSENAHFLQTANQARSIIEKRCVVCHGCYDSPCQLRLESQSGLERGAHKVKVYDGSRLFAEKKIYLFHDTKSINEWRQLGYYPVLNENKSQTNTNNLDNSLLAKLLLLKKEQPLPAVKQLPKSFDFSLNRQQHCPTNDEFDSFSKKNPLWGMPYGLPAIADEEHNILLDWIKQGAKHAPKTIPAKLKPLIIQWETFLNNESLKTQLMSRYLFEHLFLSNLYFDGVDNRKYFRIVRSRTAPGNKIDVIATRFPYDNPKVKRVYYRLMPLDTSILAKTHIPYALDKKRMQRWQSLFLDANYEIKHLPTYEQKAAANPFVAFKDIPVESRYRFLLDDAQSFISGFIKGPVCRGQVALDVVNDHFQVHFINPDSAIIKHDAKFLAQESDHLRMPNERDSGDLNVLSWLEYSKLHEAYLIDRKKYLSQVFSNNEGVDLNLFWQGDKYNKSAALTVFRHFDSATVLKGLVGEKPKTAWLIGYSLFERIHYLLVAGFDVYGNFEHQLNARLYMDFLRMEGEYNFLSALPKRARRVERDNWYRGAHDYVKKHINWSHDTFDLETNITFKSSEYKSELFDMLSNRLNANLSTKYAITTLEDEFINTQLNKLSGIWGQRATLLPELSFLTISDAATEQKVFTLIRNSAHSNISHLFSEKTERLPEEDSLTITKGIVGAYPNAFFKLTKAQLKDFVDSIYSLSSEADYEILLDRYGVRRTNQEFWAHSDFIHSIFQKQHPIEAGLLDYNRLENR